MPITECVVIASGADDDQVGAIVSGVEKKMGLAGYTPDRCEAVNEGRWILLDYVDVAVHVQHRSERNLYALEQVWRHCPLIPIRQRQGAR